MDVYEELVRLRNLGQKCAPATIVDVRGSIPGYESAKLLVREDGSMTGTIGGRGFGRKLPGGLIELAIDDDGTRGAMAGVAGRDGKHALSIAQGRPAVN